MKKYKYSKQQEIIVFIKSALIQLPTQNNAWNMSRIINRNRQLQCFKKDT